MPRSKSEVAELKKRAINSLVLAIELFNRPHEQGRAESVLIFLHHAFEMLLKAIIKDKTGAIHSKDEKFSYGFDKCLEIAHNGIKIITKDERLTLSILDSQRDIAIHYYQEISEEMLYLQAQNGVTFFDSLLNRAFGHRLADYIPERVLPISTCLPKDLQLLIDSELSKVDELLRAGSHKGTQAAARLRPILAMATASREDAERVSEMELRKTIKRRRKGEKWNDILPEVSWLKFDTKIGLQIKKDAPIAVRFAKNGEPVVGTVIKQEINIWDKYNLGRDDLAQKLGLSGPKTSALILEFKIQDDSECYKLLRRKSTSFKGYSKRALDILRNAIMQGIDVEKVWKKHRHMLGAGKNK